MGPYKVSVWSDPDIGTGTFFVILEPAKGKALTPPEGVRIGVAPVSGRLDEVIYAAEAQQVRYAARYYAEVAFDRHEWWKVRILLDGGELVTRVEATPVGLIVYLLPFLAVGFLWWKAALRRRSGR